MQHMRVYPEYYVARYLQTSAWMRFVQMLQSAVLQSPVLRHPA